MKITTKTTKEQLVEALGDNAVAIKKANADLYQQMEYSSKMMKKDPAKVTRADLVAMVKEAMKTLGDAFKEPVLTPATVGAENSIKKTLKKGAPKKSEETSEQEETAEEPTDVKVAPSEETAETKVEKSSTNKTKGAPKKEKAPKKSGVAVLNKNEETVEQATILADVFEETLTLKDDDGEEVSYEIAHDIKNMDDLFKAMEKEEVVVFAMYWTKRHLKQFPYFNGDFKAPKEFPLDLDMATCLYASDNGTCAYVMSMYTEGMYVIFPDNLEEVKGVRFSNGIEFQIYRQK